VLERLLRAAAVVLSGFVVAGFGLWAVQEMDSASAQSRARIAGDAQPAPSAASERRREERHSTAREVIDDVDDVLLAPFGGLVDGSPDRWVQRGIPALLGLALYGFLLGYLARYARGWG
jgi:hypothetical protein